MLTVSVAVMNPDTEMFKKMVTSLVKHTPEMSKLIVFDNDPENDAWVKCIDEELPTHIAFIRQKVGVNIGFGAAHNMNLEEADTPYFAVLNDDVEFFENWSSPMIETLQDEKVGQVGMMTHQCNSLNAKAQGYYTETDNPEYVEGSCFMMRTSVAKQFGLFDPAYEFAYYEDGDLSLRLRKAGYILKAINTRWIHYRAKTSSKNPVDIRGHQLNNEHVFKSRWNNYIANKKFTPLMVVKRGGAYGDVFLLEPVLEALKKKYGCAIAIMSQVPEMLIHSPNIDGHFQYQAPAQCEYFVDLDYSYERDFRKHIVDAYAQLSGVTVTRKHGTVYTSAADQKTVGRMLNGLEGFVTVDLSTTWGAKQWPKEQYGKLILALKDMGKTVVGIGKTDQYIGNVGIDYNYVNVLTPLQTAEFMSHADMHIGHEGLLGHFAQAINIKHVIMYGCTSPEFVSDTSLETWQGVISPLACQGCRHRFAAGCSVHCHRDNACMKAITVDMVLDKVGTFSEALTV